MPESAVRRETTKSVTAPTTEIEANLDWLEKPTGSVSLNLWADQPAVTAIVTKTESNFYGGISIEGHIPDQPGSHFILSYKDGAVEGAVFLPSHGNIVITRNTQNLPVIQAAGTDDTCAKCQQATTAIPAIRTRTKSIGANTIVYDKVLPPEPTGFHQLDVYFEISREANGMLDLANGDITDPEQILVSRKVNQQLDVAIREANMAFYDSKVRINPVKVGEGIPFYGPTAKAELEDFEKFAAHYYTQLGADVAVGIGRPPTSTVGSSYQRTSIIPGMDENPTNGVVARASWLNVKYLNYGTYTLAHELGHLFGADHEWENASKTSIPYRFGYGYTTTTTNNGVVTKYGDIMAAAPGIIRLPHFSGAVFSLPEGGVRAFQDATLPADQRQDVTRAIRLAAAYVCGLERPQDNLVITISIDNNLAAYPIILKADRDYQITITLKSTEADGDRFLSEWFRSTELNINHYLTNINKTSISYSFTVPKSLLIGNSRKIEIDMGGHTTRYKYDVLTFYINLVNPNTAAYDSKISLGTDVTYWPQTDSFITFNGRLRIWNLGWYTLPDIHIPGSTYQGSDGKNLQYALFGKSISPNGDLYGTIAVVSTNTTTATTRLSTATGNYKWVEYNMWEPNQIVRYNHKDGTYTSIVKSDRKPYIFGTVDKTPYTIALPRQPQFTNVIVDWRAGPPNMAEELPLLRLDNYPITEQNKSATWKAKVSLYISTKAGVPVKLMDIGTNQNWIPIAIGNDRTVLLKSGFTTTLAIAWNGKVTIQPNNNVKFHGYKENQAIISASLGMSTYAYYYLANGQLNPIDVPTTTTSMQYIEAGDAKPSTAYGQYITTGQYKGLFLANLDRDDTSNKWIVPASYNGLPKITGQTKANGTNTLTVWSWQTGDMTLESTSNLQTWTPVETKWSTAGPQTLSEANTQNQRFYRVKITR